MSRTTLFAFLAAGAVGLAGCGSSAHFANAGRPPTPVDLTVYINNARVAVSPANVGAGPVIFYVTNQASKTEDLEIEPLDGSGQALASTGPINPDSTAQVTVDFQTGNYSVATSSASGSAASGPEPATLRIGKSRPSADNVLLQP